MLLPDLIHQNDFASCLPEFQVDNWTNNVGKEEHVQKDENYEVDVICLVVLDGQNLIVREWVVGGANIRHENHWT